VAVGRADRRDVAAWYIAEKNDSSDQYQIAVSDSQQMKNINT